MASASALQISSSCSSRSSRNSRRSSYRRRPSRLCRCSSSPATVSSSSCFWERFQKAWGVLLGSSSSSGRDVMKQRFSTLLIAERGFEPDTLSHFYQLARDAISKHVVLEEAEDEHQMVSIDKIGELEFRFNVRRVKSSPGDEPWARPSLVEYEPPS